MIKKIEWTHPRFIKSAQEFKECPSPKDPRGHYLPEIAIVGRSNVGKSTLLNYLFATQKLAKVSSTPGKTQLINFFSLSDQLSFVDLPGYGFAEVPLKVRVKWGPMIQEYLSKREQLQILLFLFDIRRTPNQEDLELMRWIEHAQKKVILVLTKIDKVSHQQMVTNTQEILKTFKAENMQYVLCSAPKRIGRELLISHLSSSLDIGGLI